jgi:hypothetical protein
MLKINSITDNPDGSATLSVDLDNETLIRFAEIGLLKVLVDAANEVVTEPVIAPKLKPIPCVPCASSNPSIKCDGCDCWKMAREFSS